MNWSRWALAAMALGLVALPSVVHAQYAPGKGSLGGSIGVPFMLAPGELKRGQEPRIIGKLHFGYVFNPDLRLSLKAGYGWFGFSEDVLAPFILQAEQAGGDTTKGDQLLIFTPFTAALQYTHTFNKSWMAFGGVGPGVYRVNITNDHRTIFDPVTHERYAYTSFGATAEAGAEYFLSSNRNVSFEGVGSWNYMFDSNEDKFPSGYSGKNMFLDISFGVNVYFRPFGSPAPPATAPEPAAAPDTTTAPTDTTTSKP